MNFAVDGDRSVPTIVTNKHVVRGSDQVTAICHLADQERPSGKFVACHMGTGPGMIFNHPDPNVDLCAIPIGNILEQAMAAKKPIFCRHLGLDPDVSPRNYPLSNESK
ncbi:hypothetical protein [Nitrosomonas sp. Nm58]|uniref:hypothetical protein n=1 Tax=Nitrosomonas sp. Nm58 TaxID=200126 RepID=UPI00115FDA45|nr:hypothetical protein [Nitrosomonas sp. Nm58]